jgi:hypothetical protein
MGSDWTNAALPDVERYRGYFLSDVTVTAASAASSVRITLIAGGEDGIEVELMVEGILHLRMDTSGSWDDFVDELTAVQLPPKQPWPETARHLLHHHDGRDVLVWLRLDGPSPIEILGRTLNVVAR